MTIIHSHRVFLGASGWLHEDWHEQFYPQDLPAEWQLAYYGNEFPVVMVREQEWQQGGEVTEWLNETDETPLFICELPLHQLDGEQLPGVDSYLQKIGQLGQRCLGIVCHIDEHVDMDAFTRIITKCKQLAPTCVEIEGTASEMLAALLRTQAVSQVWNKVDETEEVNGSLVMAKIDSRNTSLKGLRKVLDNLLRYDDKKHILVLLLDGEAPDLEMIKQTKIMLELM